MLDSKVDKLYYLYIFSLAGVSMKKLVLLLVLFVSSCGFGLGVKPLYVHGENQIYRAKCNGTRRDIGDCYKQAYETCHGDFSVITDENDKGGAFYTNGVAVNAINRSLIFYCKY